MSTKTLPHVYINVQRIGDVQQLIGHPEEISLQLLGGSSTLKQEDPHPPYIKEEEEDSQPPHIKEEEEERWITQEGECLLGMQEADHTNFPLTVVSVKTEDDEEKPQPGNLLAPLSDSESEDGVEVTLSSDTDCEGDMNTPKDKKHSKCSKKIRVKKSFSCSVCPKIFSNKGNFTQHMKTHSGEKTFDCSVCGKRFCHQKVLTEHIRIHTGEKPFKCSVCDKPFSRKRVLSQHMRTHTGERPFNCSVCDKNFAQKRALIQHMRTHTGEKPFKCSVCDKSFSQKSTLSKHSRTHTGYMNT
ncbi:zinc finger protein 287-like isoform X2 [Entelurus aequoreus]|uniref:zinc finger protein 287-like isoform X2 n=1 Tax=Entelurus aequoreus TaxID=161455 RepID=UPI002B1D99ED|nr:zinc finger protein 287-like isoform X2 [Entelurus aequoreus]XP_061880622.1 zinc finger protein 287-like isoform X2 [Entelurus aequoreus]